MAIIKKDGFYFFDSHNKPLSLILDNRLDDIVDYVNRNSVSSLTVQPHLHDVVEDDSARDFLLSDVSNLDCLEKTPHLRELCLKDIRLCDIEGVYTLRELRSLTVSNAINNPSKNIRVDFSRLKALTELYVDWFDEGFDISRNENLESVSIWKFVPKSGDFTGLPLPKGIRRLEVIQSDVVSFKGLESNSIEEIECTHMPKLETLKGIENASARLKSGSSAKWVGGIV